MLLGWSSMQAQDALEVTASQAQVTQDFDSMWNGSEATLDLPQGWRVDRNLTAARTVGTYLCQRSHQRDVHWRNQPCQQCQEWHLEFPVEQHA